MSFGITEKALIQTFYTSLLTAIQTLHLNTNSTGDFVLKNWF